MAWYTYRCSRCGRTFKESLCKRESTRPCLSGCGDVAHNVIKAGTVVVHERLDNGAMARAVERIHNIEELMEERAKGSDDQEDDSGS